MEPVEKKPVIIGSKRSLSLETNTNTAAQEGPSVYHIREKPKMVWLDDLVRPPNQKNSIEQNSIKPNSKRLKVFDLMQPIQSDVSRSDGPISVHNEEVEKIISDDEFIKSLLNEEYLDEHEIELSN
ncbi:hypothetical protein PGTUg99_030718 [Puccinia graminis f. sp. tritici]|uniref:Uncharacterized protein n=1 Tax=Puccinia graminis f. sp. tritici TaxID=56615 RepID=A0A5B0Q4H5_PUCGR|nr:hypothetical protein PGTUg99_030718 [Puccinia graminis f. sp. tritici]